MLGLSGSSMKIDNEARRRSTEPMPICSKVRRTFGNTIFQLDRPTVRGPAASQSR